MHPCWLISFKKKSYWLWTVEYYKVAQYPILGLKKKQYIKRRNQKMNKKTQKSWNIPCIKTHSFWNQHSRSFPRHWYSWNLTVLEPKCKKKQFTSQTTNNQHIKKALKGIVSSQQVYQTLNSLHKWHDRNLYIEVLYVETLLHNGSPTELTLS